MKLLHNLAIAGVLSVAAVGTAAGPAAAGVPDHYVLIWNDSRCDSATGEWIAIYHVSNSGTMNATFSAASPTAPITGLEGTEVEPRHERVGEQRLPPGVSYAQLLVTATWADYTVTSHGWQYRNPAMCTKTD